MGGRGQRLRTSQNRGGASEDKRQLEEHIFMAKRQNGAGTIVWTDSKGNVSEHSTGTGHGKTHREFNPNLKELEKLDIKQLESMYEAARSDDSAAYQRLVMQAHRFGASNLARATDARKQMNEIMHVIRRKKGVFKQKR